MMKKKHSRDTFFPWRPPIQILNSVNFTYRIPFDKITTHAGVAAGQ